MSSSLSADIQVGGYVRRGYIYISRPDDDKLLQHLSNKDYCYVFAPRQVGKSSLRVRTAEKLKDQGVLCAQIDLTTVGSKSGTEDQWYFSVTAELATELDLPNPWGFWQDNTHLSPLYRWHKYLRDLVIKLQPTRIVIFIDEIDVTLSVPFKRSDFFAGLRGLYEERSRHPMMEKLTFCLLGVATPSELMADEQHTPFNVAVPILLDDFSADQIYDALLNKFEQFPFLPREWTDAIHKTTSGHPVMTMELAWNILERSDEIISMQYKDRIWIDKIISEIINQPDCFRAPLNEVDRRLPDGDGRALAVLGLYRRILSNETISCDNKDHLQLSLRMTGLVASRTGRGQGTYLETRNPIFANRFDRKWLDRKELRPFSPDEVKQWIENNRSTDYLMYGDQLVKALSWQRQRGYLSPEEQDYLDASKRREWRGQVLFLSVSSILILAIFFIVFKQADSDLRSRLSSCASKTSGLEFELNNVRQSLNNCNTEKTGYTGKIDSLMSTVAHQRFALERYGILLQNLNPNPELGTLLCKYVANPKKGEERDLSKKFKLVSLKLRSGTEDAVRACLADKISDIKHNNHFVELGLTDDGVFNSIEFDFIGELTERELKCLRGKFLLPDFQGITRSLSDGKCKKKLNFPKKISPILKKSSAFFQISLPVRK